MPRPMPHQRDWIVTCTHEVYVDVKAHTEDEAKVKALRQERTHFHNLTPVKAEVSS